MRLPRAFTIASLSVFALILVRTAWVGDDAYFTFRTIDNFTHGYGLRWNVAERVQVYTHPLWMALVAAFYWWTGEPYFTSIAISITLTLVTLWLLMRLAGSVGVAAAGLTVLFCSRAFIDYSTSGLENSLTNLLVVLFITCYRSVDRRFVVSSLVAALLMLNRLDAGLLVLPAWAALVPRRGVWRDYARIAVAFLPLVLWEVFSVLYYGVPFPNTAYAKLRTAIPERELLHQGFAYLLDSVRYDPVTLLATLGTAVWTLIENPRAMRPVSLGILVNVAYVTLVGGDFMSGRMLAAPLVAAVAILVVSDARELIAYRFALAPLVVIFGFVVIAAFAQKLNPAPVPRANGVADERMVYFESNGLVNYSRGAAWPNNPWLTKGLQARREGKRLVLNCCNGMLGYAVGPDVYVLDLLALGDPLLSRLPAEADWRIGHFERRIPRGYVETLESGVNQIADPNLAAYYDRLSLMTRGRIFDRKRLITTWRFNLGQYDRFLRQAGGAAAPCTYAFLSTAEHLGTEGGDFSAIVTGSPAEGCPWTVTSSDSWITLTGPTRGNGPAVVNFSASRNTMTDQRVGTITVASPAGVGTLKVLQPGLPQCAFTVTPRAQEVSSAGGGSIFAVTPSDNSCAWRAESKASWLSMTAGVDNTGPGVVHFAVRPNATRAARVGTVAIRGFVSGEAAVVITQKP